MELVSACCTHHVQDLAGEGVGGCDICTDCGEWAEIIDLDDEIYGVMKYRKRPIEVEAIQWLGSNEKEIVGWLESRKIDNYCLKSNLGDYSDLCVLMESPIAVIEYPVPHGDWIIRSLKGDVYPCRDEIFKDTYDLVKE